MRALERTLFNNIPWIGTVIKISSLEIFSIDDANLRSNLQALVSLTQKDRILLSAEFKSAWTLSEGIRGSFKLLVEDFIKSSSNRIRLGVFTRYYIDILVDFTSNLKCIRAQQVTDEILHHFKVSATLTEEDRSGFSAEESSIDLAKLRLKLSEEVTREALSYLFIMNVVVDNGDNAIKGKRHIF